MYWCSLVRRHRRRPADRERGAVAAVGLHVAVGAQPARGDRVELDAAEVTRHASHRTTTGCDRARGSPDGRGSPRCLTTSSTWWLLSLLGGCSAW